MNLLCYFTIYVNQTLLLCNLNLYRNVCQLFLNKIGKKEVKKGIITMLHQIDNMKKRNYKKEPMEMIELKSRIEMKTSLERFNSRFEFTEERKRKKLNLR